MGRVVHGVEVPVGVRVGGVGLAEGQAVPEAELVALPEDVAADAAAEALGVEEVALHDHGRALAAGRTHLGVAAHAALQVAPENAEEEEVLYFGQKCCGVLSAELISPTILRPPEKKTDWLPFWSPTKSALA